MTMIWFFYYFPPSWEKYAFWIFSSRSCSRKVNVDVFIHSCVKHFKINWIRLEMFLIFPLLSSSSSFPEKTLPRPGWSALGSPDLTSSPPAEMLPPGCTKISPTPEYWHQRNIQQNSVVLSNWNNFGILCLRPLICFWAPTAQNRAVGGCGCGAGTWLPLHCAALTHTIVPPAATCSVPAQSGGGTVAVYSGWFGRCK